MSSDVIRILPAIPELAAAIGDQISALVRATGPVSYDYQFGTGDLLDRIVTASWATPSTLFSASSTTLAIEGDVLLGIELGFAGPDFYAFKANLASLAPTLIGEGKMTIPELLGLAQRAEKASYLNAHVPDNVYYLHAISILPQHRGRGVGRSLLEAAMVKAKSAGHQELQLDVFADNAAVGFYRSMGLDVLVELKSPDLTRDYGFPAELRMAISL